MVLRFTFLFVLHLYASRVHILCTWAEKLVAWCVWLVLFVLMYFWLYCRLMWGVCISWHVVKENEKKKKRFFQTKHHLIHLTVYSAVAQWPKGFRANGGLRLPLALKPFTRWVFWCFILMAEYRADLWPDPSFSCWCMRVLAVNFWCWQKACIKV